MFNLDIKKLPDRNAAKDIFSQCWTESQLLEKKRRVKEEIKDPVIEKIKKEGDVTKWEEEFKKYNTKRENAIWIRYFELKKECNRIKFQKERSKTIQENNQYQNFFKKIEIHEEEDQEIGKEKIETPELIIAIRKKYKVGKRHKWK
jgi:hypothetical protein